MNAFTRDPHSFEGRVEMRPFASDVLADNPLGDPTEREVPVWLPPGVEPDSRERYPVVYVLAGFTGRPHKYLETHPWHAGVVARYDRLVAVGDAPPAILVLPDAFTKLGGSQYVDSPAVGRYEEYVVGEIVPWIDEHYPTDPGRRAICGKSSGGFGAFRLAMRHPRVFRAAASISGDMGFELSFAHEIPACLRGLVAHGGDPRAFLASFFEDPRLDGDAHAVLNVLAMAACYSPNPESELGFDLPMDLETGERRDDVWRRWLTFDPLHACREHVDALRSLALLHLECGLKDQFHLQWGLRQLVRELVRLGVPFEHEEHDGSHFGIDDRFLGVIPKLVAAL